MAILVTDPNKIRDAHYKYLDVMGMIWITFLIVSTITSAKTFDIGPFSFSVAVIFYPITYIFADIFTEVYGYKKTRRIVWAGLACLIVSSVIPYIYALVPPSASFTDNQAFTTIFKGSPVLAFAVVCCFFAGEFSNSFILAKMKIMTSGKHLWLRLVSSTAVGQTADNTTFYIIAYFIGGFYSLPELPNLIFSTVLFCTMWEFLATPVTYKVANFLKKAEGLDIYDRGTDFNPFSLRS